MKFKKLNNLAKTPTRADEGSAGYDLYAATSYSIEIKPHQTVKIDTGIALEIDHGFFGMLVPRSGIATKRSLRPANTPGIIDESYRGNIIIALHNDSDIPQWIEAQERIAQLILVPYHITDWEEVDELSETERGDGGFGHSGTT